MRPVSDRNLIVWFFFEHSYAPKVRQATGRVPGAGSRLWLASAADCVGDGDSEGGGADDVAEDSEVSVAEGSYSGSEEDEAVQVVRADIDKIQN